MYRFLLSRQWVILTLLALLLIPTMVWLGFWQLDRHEQRVARNDLISASLDAEPVPMAELTTADGGPAPDDRYRPVTATGVYDVAHQVLVRQRTNGDGAMGYHVLTPLLPADGGPAVLVNRGWIAAGQDLTEAPEVPAPPTGEVTVTGRLMADETTANTGVRDRSGLPDGMTMLINSDQREADLGQPMLGGYLELTETSPPDPAEPALEPVPEPDHTGIGAHFAYAIQWWLFAAGVPVGWFLLLRRDANDRRADAAAAAGRAGGRQRPKGAAAGAAGAAEAGERDEAGAAGAGVVRERDVESSTAGA
ncbi:SURF1 family cytochrome oxidase biogenesis protein [Streptomyces triticirhizae]|uniref:SURF1-like protein n=1 Tax=Streptomyces triticirhizae TaxID=2483353 RepID=A0A3M2LB56_9ACTN|nr:SURF1 family protein [Streptomyces triticirhizae]RMI34789.1 SURF1 family protein [Streptomyces triticirhizae]